MEFTHIDTAYEPPSVSYSEMFSWQGEEFPKRTNQHDEVAAREKRSSKRKTKSQSVIDKLLMSDFFTKATVTPEEGVFVIAENVTIIDDYLYGSPRIPFRGNRRIFAIAITKPEERNFDKRVKKLLKRLWEDYGVADVILITPCNNDPEVNLLRTRSFLSRINGQKFLCFVGVLHILSIQKN